MPKRKKGGEPDPEPFNEFEAERERLIARNRALLEQLGISTAAEKLAETIKKSRPAKKPRTTPKPKKTASSQPSRRSSRLAKSAGEDQSALEEDPASQFTKFVIDGECPKCARVVTRGHKRHLESCQGRPENTADEIPLTEEEIAEQDRVQSERDATKIRELELSGLIEYTEDAAKFAIIGSTGKHYVVTLSEARQTCQCMDFRIRKRACKHIKLVLKQLAIEEDPKAWKEASVNLLVADKIIIDFHDLEDF
ncbi:hypothetical protein BSKO_02134 [Bryopsis sp. KO-2023]|nr:hypothetical protein BSKO_02134 [Bryopsis sp. KO-2023]